MAEISVQRALTELKTIDERIKAAMQSLRLIFIAQGQGDKRKVPQSTLTVTEVENLIKSSYQSIQDLIERRQKLKNAIMHSNFTTKVTIGDKEYTVQQAIDQKQVMLYKHELAIAMNKQIAGSLQTMTNLQKQLDDKIERSVTAVYGNDRGKVTEDQLGIISKSHREESEPSFIDPLKLEVLRDKLVNDVNVFLSEINYALSESNAKTMISID